MMRLIRALVCVFALCAPASAAERFAPMQKMCSLAGEWEGVVLTNPGGPTGPGAHIKYEAVSNGYAVVETLTMHNEHHMISVYYQEGDQLMMTHFCSSNTQPRLRTKSIPADLSEFKLEFVDSTNIMKANWMNIVWMKVEFLKDGRIRQSWKTHDEHEVACVMEFQRVK